MSNHEVVINGEVYVKKEKEQETKKTINIFEYCKNKNVWAARDSCSEGRWCWYKEKPYLIKNDFQWYPQLKSRGLFWDVINKNEVICPDYVWNLSLISPEGVFYKEPKWEPKKGEPIFVWDNGSENTIPAAVVYFYSYDKSRAYPIKIYGYSKFNEQGSIWSHCRKFDASLVGVPRKDWPKGDEL